MPSDLRQRTAAIGVTGQMHGILVLDRNRSNLTPLITWQDQRCLEDLFFGKLSPDAISNRYRLWLYTRHGSFRTMASPRSPMHSDYPGPRSGCSLRPKQALWIHNGASWGPL
ncbi:MAG: FGGY family carbohydrate kinase [Terriglobia bacterium]